MNYKEKYEQALERAKDMLAYKEVRQEDMEYLFPELKESEDERIRKTLIEYIKGIKSWNYFLGISKGQMIAWLEKQKKQKHFSDFNADDWYVSKVDGKIHNAKFIKFIEKQDEEKSIDEVGPKFKIGNWITDGHLTCKVLSVTGKFYELHLYNDDYCHFETDVQSVDKRYHLWTIADAKDGDVLVVNNEVFIYAHRKQMYSIAVAHCFVDSAGDFYLDGEFGYEENWRTISPATKKQFDLLFQKMKEASYEWDADKKELKRVEPKILDINTVIGQLLGNC